MSKNILMEIERSRTGSACMWEQGGSYTNTGSSQIITDSTGGPKKPIYTRMKGNLACDKHALIPIQVNDHVIKTSHHREDFDISVYRVEIVGEKICLVTEVATFSQGEWIGLEDLQGEFFERAIQGAKMKALTYHCRCPHYISE